MPGLPWQNRWVTGFPWAAEPLEYRGRFYYHFTAPGRDSEGVRKIGVGAWTPGSSRKSVEVRFDFVRVEREIPPRNID